MTAESRTDEERPVAEMPATPRPSEAHAGNSVPRVWTVFLAYLAAFAGAVLVQIIAAIVLVIWHVTHGGSISQLSRDLQAMLSTPAARHRPWLDGATGDGIGGDHPGATVQPSPPAAGWDCWRPSCPRGGT